MGRARALSGGLDARDSGPGLENSVSRPLRTSRMDLPANMIIPGGKPRTCRVLVVILAKPLREGHEGLRNHLKTESRVSISAREKIGQQYLQVRDP